MTTGAEGSGNVHSLFNRQHPLESLSRFASNLACCWEAGIAIDKSLETTLKTLSSVPDYSDLAADALDRCKSGAPVWRSLSAFESHLPSFFVPVIRYGEENGRLGEALHYLESHCQIMAEPLKQTRNMWQIALTILVLGFGLNVVTRLLLAPSISVLVETAISVGIAVLAYRSRNMPIVRQVVSRLRLAIPVFGEVEKNLSLSRFFHVLNLIYSTADKERVENMLNSAGEAIDNVVLRQDLLQTVEVVHQGGDLGAAFARPAYLTESQKSVIVAAEFAGSLEEAFVQIADHTAADAEGRIVEIGVFYYRVFVPLAALGIVGMIVSLVSTVVSALAR